MVYVTQKNEHFFYTLLKNKSSSRFFTQFPLGPYKYPLLGNLPQLAGEFRKGKKPYVVLKDLAKTYGHRMSLHFGSTYQGNFCAICFRN